MLYTYSKYVGRNFFTLNVNWYYFYFIYLVPRSEVLEVEVEVKFLEKVED